MGHFQFQSLIFSFSSLTLRSPTPPSSSTFCGQVQLVGRQPPSAATDELVAMGTVNGLESEDSGPDINTQHLILPADSVRKGVLGGQE